MRTRLVGIVIATLVVLSGCEFILQLIGANDPPVADAGGDQMVILGETVTLDGTASSDPDGDVLEFHWELTGFPQNGGETTINNATDVTASFTPPVLGEYTVRLTVTDELLSNGTAEATITVLQDESLPSAPANVAATAGDEEVTVSWDDDPLATGYTVYWGYTPGVDPASADSFADVNNPFSHDYREPGIDYYYVVVGENPFGVGPVSTEVSAAPNAIAPPGSPSFSLADGPAGGESLALIADGTTIYASFAGGGVFRTSDAGFTWEQMGGFLAGDATALAVDSSYLYAGITGTIPINVTVKRVSKSGGSWSAYDTSFPTGLSAGKFRDLLVAGDYLYAGVSSNAGNDSSVYRTDLTSSVSWVDISFSSGATGSGGTWALASDGTRLYAGVQPATGFGSEKIWYRPLDLSSGWAQAGSGITGLPYDLIFFEVAQYDFLIAVSNDGTSRVARWDLNNDDFGTDTWDYTFGDGTGISRLGYRLSQIGSYVYVSDRDGGVVRTNGYQAPNWTEIGSGLPSVLNSQVDVVTDGTVLMVGEVDGVYINPSQTGSTWNFSVNGPTASNIHDIVGYENQLFVAADHGVWVHELDTGDWSVHGTGLTEDVIALDRGNGQLFAGTSGGDLYSVSENGGSWTYMTNFPQLIYDVIYHNGTLYVADESGVIEVDTTTGDQTAVSAGYIWAGRMAASGNTLFGADFEGDQVRSVDLTSGAVTNIGGAGATDLMVYDGWLYATRDSGTAGSNLQRYNIASPTGWQPLANSWAPGSGTAYSLATDGSYVYSTWSDANIYRLPIETTSATTYGSGLPANAFGFVASNWAYNNAMYIKDGTFFVGGTGKGLWASN